MELGGGRVMVLLWHHAEKASWEGERRRERHCSSSSSSLSRLQQLNSPPILTLETGQSKKRVCVSRCVQEVGEQVATG